MSTLSFRGFRSRSLIRKTYRRKGAGENYLTILSNGASTAKTVQFEMKTPLPPPRSQSPKKKSQAQYAMVKSWIRTGGLARANFWFQSAKQLDPKPNATLCSLLIRSQSEPKRALELFREMKETGVRSHRAVFSALIQVLWDKQRETIFELFKKEQDVLPRIAFYKALIKKFYKVGDLDTAEEWYSKMKEEVQPDICTYSLLLGVNRQLRRWEKGLELYEEMKKNGVQPDEKFYSQLIYFLCENQQREKALAMYEEMRRQGMTPGKQVSRAVTISDNLVARY